MALPSSYTETTLAEYALSVLGQVASFIGWTTATDAAEVVNDVLFEMGVSDISTVTDADELRWMRSLTKYYSWKAAAELTSGKYDFSTGDSGSFKRSQVHDMALENMQNARYEADGAAESAGESAYPPVRISDIRYVNDPYKPIDTEEDSA